MKTFVFSIFLTTLSTVFLRAQNCGTVHNLPDSVFSCDKTFQLNPTVLTNSAFIPLDTIWSPATGLSDPDIINPMVMITPGGQLYHLSITGLDTNNLVVNGDFSSGNTGFSSSYILGTGGPFGPLSGAGQYAIANNTGNAHVLFASFGDHTTGNGLMMVVNGASTPNVNIWCQTITVQPNSFYDFSAWVATPYANNPAILQFAINGNLLGNAFNAPAMVGLWSQFRHIWHSGGANTATICITTQSTALDGNDFALDDIAFRSVCIITDSVFVQSRTLTVQAYFPDTVCLGVPVYFYGNDSSSFLAYYWEFGDGTIAMNPTANHFFSATGKYSIVYAVTDSAGCTDTFRKDIVVVQPPETYLIRKLCRGEVMMFENQQIADSGVYTHIFSSVSGCDSLVVWDVRFSENPEVDFYYEIHAPVRFTNSTINATTFLWDFGDGNTSTETNPEHEYLRTESYKVCLTGWNEDGCVGIECKSLNVEVDMVADVPSAFSPNNDGYNDILYVRGKGVLKLSFRIYNRWGQIIFETNDMKKGWDGTYKGAPVDMEAVAYVLQVVFIDGSAKQTQGNITLIR